MASKLANIHPICCLLFLLFCVLSISSSATTQLNFFPELSDTLARKGYFSMSQVVDLALPKMLETYKNISTSGLTLFVPNDKAFSISQPKYIHMDPPITLLRYHAVPIKIERETIESISYCSKIDTLLLDGGVTLIITSTPHDGEASINSVKITEWNLYNHSNIIVHGIQEFFDPAMPILFPITNKPGILGFINEDDDGIQQKSLARTFLGALEDLLESQFIVIASFVLISLILFLFKTGI